MSKELEYLELHKHPVARLAAAAAMWLQTAPVDERERDPMMSQLVEEAIEEAWRYPDVPRMTLVMLGETRGWDRRELARILGISPVQYNKAALGRHPLGRVEVEKIAAAKEVPLVELQGVVLLTHVLMIELDTGWEMKWQESLEPLTPRERRAKILEDKDLQNWGLGKLVCTKSLEAGDPDEAVTLAELALLIMEKHKLGASFQRRLQGYAWGHLGHALERRGDYAAAETAYAECIQLWTTGEGIMGREDRNQAERLASIVPSFPPCVPPPRRRKRAKRTGSPKTKPQARRAG